MMFLCLKKMTKFIENDVMLNNEKKTMFLCLKKWQESQKMTLVLKKNDTNHGKWHYAK